MKDFNLINTAHPCFSFTFVFLDLWLLLKIDYLLDLVFFLNLILI